MDRPKARASGRRRAAKAERRPNPRAGSVRHVAQPSLAAGSGGFPAADFKNRVQMRRQIGYSVNPLGSHGAFCLIGRAE